MIDTPQLYATYLEMTHPTSDGDRRRMQYVVLPQLPARLAPGSAPFTSHLSSFSREQDRASHRAVWRYAIDTNDSLKDHLGRQVRIYTNAGWNMAPIITCEVDPTELADIIKNPKTPYRILQRLQKVARAKHRIDIS